MSYRIEYDMHQMKKYPVKRTLAIHKKMISALMIILAIGLIVFWRQAEGGILELLYPGEGIRAQEAMEQMADNIQSGENIIDAFTQFCRQIIEYA